MIIGHGKLIGHGNLIRQGKYLIGIDKLVEFPLGSSEKGFLRSIRYSTCLRDPNQGTKDTQDPS